VKATLHWVEPRKQIGTTYELSELSELTFVVAFMRGASVRSVCVRSVSGFAVTLSQFVPVTIDNWKWCEKLLGPVLQVFCSLVFGLDI
jgi:hypothetical protein